MIVKWQEIREDTELKNYSHGTSYGTNGKKML